MRWEGGDEVGEVGGEVGGDGVGGMRGFYGGGLEGCHCQ